MSDNNAKRMIQAGRRNKEAKRNIFTFIAADKRDGNEKRIKA